MAAAKPPDDGHHADRTRPASAVLEPDRQAEQDVEVLFDGSPDSRPLNLNRHLGTRVGPGTQPAPVNLGDPR